MIRSRDSLLALAVLAELALLAGCGSSTNKLTGAHAVKPLVLTLASPNADDLEVGDWMRAVDRLSHGRVRISLRSNWRIDEAQADRGTLADVRAGKVDMAKIPARAWDTLGLTSFRALQAPLLVDSLELERRVVAGPVGARMLAGLRTARVEPVAVLPGPLKRALGVSRDLLAPRDYSGALMGVRASAVAVATARALGARPREVSAVASLAGLDAFDASLLDIDVSRYDRQAHSVTADVVLWPKAVTLVMNLGSWRRLSSAQRAVLVRAGREAVAPMIAEWRDFDRTGANSLCARRFALLRAGSARIRELRQALEPVYRTLEADPRTRWALNRIRELKAASPAAEAPSCGSAGARPASATGPLVGEWHTHATQELMAAAHREVGESIEENYGDVTLELKPNGRYVISNSRADELVGFGTWTVDGDVLVMREEGTVDQGAGERWRYRWTLFRGSLGLKKLTVAPTALTVAPLRRGSSP